MTRNAILVAAGEALFGSRWQTDAAEALEVSDRTVRRWVSGEDTPRNGVLRDLQTLLRRRRARLEEIEAQIDAALSLENQHP